MLKVQFFGLAARLRGGALTLLCALAANLALAQEPRLRELCGECVFERYAKCEGKHFLEGPAFDRQGRLWLTGLESGAVLRVDGRNQCTVVKKVGKGLNGAKFDAQGRLLLTDVELGLLRFDTATQEVTVLRGKHGREMFRGLNDIAVDKAGGIYFTESWGSHALKRDGRVFYLSGDDVDNGKRDLMVVATGIGFPNGVALSSDEKELFVGEYAQNQVLKLPLSGPGLVSVNGVPHVFARMTGGTGPDGLALDTAGNLYAAHFRAGQVMVTDRSGFPYGAIRLPQGSGLGTTNLALHEGYLYLTEAFNDEVWRVKINTQGQLAPNLR